MESRSLFFFFVAQLDDGLQKFPQTITGPSPQKR